MGLFDTAFSQSLEAIAGIAKPTTPPKKPEVAPVAPTAKKVAAPIMTPVPPTKPKEVENIASSLFGSFANDSAPATTMKIAPEKKSLVFSMDTQQKGSVLPPGVGLIKKPTDMFNALPESEKKTVTFSLNPEEQHLSPFAEANATVDRQVSFGAPVQSPTLAGADDLQGFDKAKVFAQSAGNTAATLFDSFLVRPTTAALNLGSAPIAMGLNALSGGKADNMEIAKETLSRTVNQLDFTQPAKDQFAEAAQMYLRDRRVGKYGDQKVSAGDVAALSFLGALQQSIYFLNPISEVKSVGDAKHFLQYAKVGERLIDNTAFSLVRPIEENAMGARSFGKPTLVFNEKLGETGSKIVAVDTRNWILKKLRPGIYDASPGANAIKGKGVDVQITPEFQVRLTPTTDGKLYVEGYRKRFGGAKPQSAVPEATPLISDYNSLPDAITEAAQRMGIVPKGPGFAAEGGVKYKLAEEAATPVAGAGGVFSKIADSAPAPTASKPPPPETFQGYTDLTTKVLDKLKGRSSVSKQFISDLTNTGDLKQTERDVIRQQLTGFGDQVPVKEFADRVKADLLPLKVNSSDTYKVNPSASHDPESMVSEGGFTPKYENISLPEEVRGDVGNYKENIYESPVGTSAGDVHFGYTTKNYFGHTRVEDMADGTRRVIEVQSDLFQKGGIDKERTRDVSEKLNTLRNKYINEEASGLQTPAETEELLKKAEIRLNAEKESENNNIAKLEQYNDPTAHFRMIREEYKKAAEDGKSVLQFPTGDTAMKIEGLGRTTSFDLLKNTKGDRAGKLTPENMKVGSLISNEGDIMNGEESEYWVITNILGDGKFQAVPKRFLGDYSLQETIKNADATTMQHLLRAKETFDISGKMDTSNPIHKFYEKEVGKYLKNKYGAKLVTDDQGVTWWQVDVKPEAADAPVEAFKVGNDAKYNMTRDEGAKILKQFFGEKDADFMTSKGLGNVDNKQVLGQYAKSLIEVLENDGLIADKVLFHEAFHKYVDVYLTEGQRAELLIEGRKHGIENEEDMADAFADYTARRRTFFGRILEFFKRLRSKINHWIGEREAVQQAFDDLHSGKAAERGVAPRPMEPIATSKTAEFEQWLEAKAAALPEQEAKSLLRRGKLEPFELEREFENQELEKINNEIKLDIDEESQAKGYAESVYFNPDGKGIKTFAPDLKNAFQDWVNERSASRIEGFLKKKEFADLDDGGLDAIINFQAGDKSGRLADVDKYFTDKYQEVKKNGVDLGYLKNYVPQLWEESAQEVNEILGKHLTRNPSFNLHRVIESYRLGIEMGLTPRYTKLSELIGWYERTANKTIADRTFFQYLADHNMVAPMNHAPIGWKTLDPDLFPKITVRTGADSTYGGSYVAPPDLADVINNYLRPAHPFLATVADFTSKVKNIVLSSGIPFTGINAHGLNILVRHALGSNNPIPAFVKGLWYLGNPKATEKFLEMNAATAIEAVKNGLTLSSESDTAFDKQTDKIKRAMIKRSKDGTFRETIPSQVAGFLGTAYKKFTGIQSKLFEEALFNKVIPTFKLSYYNVIKDDLIKHYPEDQAGKMAAEITNNIFGGINVDAMARDKNIQAILKIFILAPDWAETQIRIAANSAQGFKNFNDKRYTAYRKFIRNFFLAFATMQVLSFAINKHGTWDNEAGHTFELQLGSNSQGKPRYLRPYGTALDMLRLPFDVSLALAKGDLSAIGRIVRNRLSIPVGNVLSLAANVDPLGRPILGKDKYGNPIPLEQQIGSVFNMTAGMATPQWGQALVDMGTGKSGWEETIARATEFPLRYGNANNEYYDALNTIDQNSTQESKTFEPTYAKIRSLVDSGKTEEAQTVIDDLDDNQYDLYKQMLSKEKSKENTRYDQGFFGNFKDIRKMVVDGNASDATEKVDALSDDDYESYQRLHKKFPDAVLNIGVDKPTTKDKALDEIKGKTSERGVIDTVMTYAKAIGADPVVAFDRILTGQTIRRIDNGAIIVERMSLDDSQAVKTERNGNTDELKLDHTVPLELGGSNSKDNLKLVSTDVWKSYSPIENYLGNLLRRGVIDKKRAQQLITAFKAGEATADEIRAIK